MILFEICRKYFENSYNIEEWHVGTLKVLPKKGDVTNPNNERVINLLDVVSKTISLSSNKKFSRYF